MPRGSQVVGAVERSCREAADERAMRVEVLERLVPALRVTAWAWLLTDPVTAVGASPVAVVPWMADLPRQVLWKYASAVNRWTALEEPVALLHEATGGDLTRSAVWREVLRHHDVVDAASVVLRDRYGTWSFLELWRQAPEPPFDEGDRALLGAVTPALTAAVRSRVAASFGGAGRPAPAPAVLLLTDDLQVRAQTPETEALLRTLLPTPVGAPAVPAVALNVAAQLLAVEAGVDGSPPRARQAAGEGCWVTAEAARLGPGEIAVTLAPARPVDRLEVLGRAVGLTARESELVALLAEGADTREVAARLSLSQHTVQDHLKAVFDKAGVRSRRALVALAVGPG